jgi:hypothetical protein
MCAMIKPGEVWPLAGSVDTLGQVQPGERRSNQVRRESLLTLRRSKPDLTGAVLRKMPKWLSRSGLCKAFGHCGWDVGVLCVGRQS